MYNKRAIGGEQEQIAKEFLVKHGYEIIEQNFQCRTGEIDLIAKESSYLVFVEVKYRSSSKYGTPHEAVDYRKIKSIVRVAKFYMISHGIQEQTPCRFDVIVIERDAIELIQNAFDAM